MKFVKAIWPFVAVAIVFMFMSAFKLNKIQQQEEPVNANK